MILAIAVSAVALFQASGTQPRKPIDPVGAYAVSTLSDTGQAMAGTLTISMNAAGDHAGQFVSPALPAPVPIASVAVNGGEMVVILKPSPKEFAVVWVERAADGAFKGTWHKLGDGTNATMTRMK
jgi:hypothetical protein